MGVMDSYDQSMINAFFVLEAMKIPLPSPFFKGGNPSGFA